MIQISLYHDGEGQLERVVIKGHAGYAEPGEDIVCAAVSSISIGLVNAAEALLGVRLYQEDMNPDEGGLLDCNIPEGLPADRRERVQFLLEAMAVALQSVADEYPSFVSMNHLK